MSTLPDIASLTSSPEIIPGDGERARVLWDWCLRRETGRWLTQAMLLAPIILLELITSIELSWKWHPGQGHALLMGVYALAAVVIVGGGAIHAAPAICWEMSPELRELVRITGANPFTLMLCRTLSRWLTIGIAVLLLSPMVCYSRSLGEFSFDQLRAIGLALFMLAVLTAGFALLAGAAATEMQNPALSAAMGTFILLLLYHMLFWMAAGLVFVVYGLTTGDWNALPYNSSWRTWSDFGLQSTPIAVLIRAGRAPERLSPLAPTYWIHFIAAVFAMRLATAAMVYRFQSTPTLGQDSGPLTTSAGKATRRPRCSASPLFWKDFQILASGSRSQFRWDIMSLLITVGIVTIHMTNSEWDSDVLVAMLSLCALPAIFAVRVDSLIAVEFRHQTWQSLMLLPVPRQSIYWNKLRAVAWQQRLLLLPAGIAAAFGGRHHPVAVGMGIVLAFMTGLLLCQVAAVYYLTRHQWWRGPIHALMALVLIVLCLVIWFNFPPWISFFMTLLLMTVTYIPVQHYIDETLRQWTEP